MLSISSSGACDGHETLFSAGVHARPCLALGSRTPESSGILWEILIRETLIDAVSKLGAARVKVSSKNKREREEGECVYVCLDIRQAREIGRDRGTAVPPHDRRD
jgi:hypothetical protein